jgi:hypothetical protein
VEPCDERANLPLSSHLLVEHLAASFGDVPNPVGGVCNMIPGKGDYLPSYFVK